MATLKDWLTQKPAPSQEMARQLLMENPGRRLIGDHLLTDDEVDMLRDYIATLAREFPSRLTLNDDYPAAITPLDDRGLFTA